MDGVSQRERASPLSPFQRQRLDAAVAANERARRDDNRLRTPETKAAREKAHVELRLAGMAAEREIRMAFGL